MSLLGHPGPDLLVGSFFVAALLAHLVLSAFGLDHTLLELHNFRQTQTAMTAFWVVREGWQMPYITPFTGAPWAIPMEFPLYQWLVAGLTALTGARLEVYGRLVALAAFYAALLPLYRLLRAILTRRTDRLLVITLTLAHPVYLYWSMVKRSMVHGRWSMVDGPWRRGPWSIDHGPRWVHFTVWCSGRRSASGRLQANTCDDNRKYLQCTRPVAAHCMRRPRQGHDGLKGG